MDIEMFNSLKISEEEEEDDIYEDPYENYCRVQQTVTFLTNGGRVTEDWMEEHVKHIVKYSEIFYKFSEMNPEIEDPEFRHMAVECETILTNLINYIDTYGSFDIDDYLLLNQNMLKMCEYTFTDDELEICMRKLSIKSEAKG